MGQIKFPNSKEAKYIMTRLAKYKQDPTKETTIGETNLEHIFPQNPEDDEWGGEANHAKLSSLLWHIGNLTIFGRTKNRKAANKEFSIKRELYKQSNLIMTQEIAKDYPDWNVSAILGRAKKLAPLVEEIWSFDNPTRV